MNKRFIALLIFVAKLNFIPCISYAANVCNPVCDPVDREEQKHVESCHEELIKNFKPNFHIKEQLPQDLEVLNRMRNLFFEVDSKGRGGNSKRGVYNRAIKEYDAQEIMLLTRDNFRLSSLYFKRPSAPVNILYVTGYFHNETPLKEWVAPFAELFPCFNIFAFDWRGFGNSEGISGQLGVKNSFGANAYPDIQAAIDFIRKDNDKPIVMVGFCIGAAMAMKATIEAMEKGQSFADALVIDSTFTMFENQFNRSASAADSWSNWFLINSGAGAFILDSIMNGSLFDLKPVEMIEKIKIPCFFEHFTDDPFAIIEEGIIVFGRSPSFKMFLQSDLGRHVRIHSTVPYQYRNAFYEFLLKSGLMGEKDFNFLGENDLNILKESKKNEDCCLANRS